MHLRQLAVLDFRSYERAQVDLDPGVTTFLGRNGQGKTNLVEAAGYLAGLRSHRTASDGPLIRAGAESAIVRGTVVRDGRDVLLEVQLTPGRANRARVNRAELPRTRDLLGHLRTVLFAPEDLALVKGDPSGRRAFLDALLVARQPRWAAALSDYDRLLRQRTTLLKQLRTGARGPRRAEAPVADGESALGTLDIWDERLIDLGTALLYARLRLVADLRPFVQETYADLSRSDTAVQVAYRSSLAADGEVHAALQDPGAPVPDQDLLRTAFRDSLAAVRAEELDRGVTLVGPHRDEVELGLGGLPARGYASQGESWSLALGLRLASFALLRRDLGTDPVLVLDDVFAELDAGRRERLADLVADSEQVLVTAAVAEDVPVSLLEGSARRYVRLGEVAPEPFPALEEGDDERVAEDADPAAP